MRRPPTLPPASTTSTSTRRRTRAANSAAKSRSKPTTTTMKKGGRRAPAFSVADRGSAVFDAERLVTAAAGHADRREVCLERVGVLDVRLGLGDGLGKVVDLCSEAH